MRPNPPESCALGRRNFLLASAALGTSLLLPGGARAVQIKRMEGQVTVNGKAAKTTTRIKPGDTIATAAGAKLVFAVGQDAFLLRGGSKLKLDASKTGKEPVVSGLRLLTGALLAVLGQGARRIETTTATAGIRGTGVYIEASAKQTYFCTCYGEVELTSRKGNERKLVISGYHTPTMIYAQPSNGKMMSGAAFKDHTDEELIMLSRVLGQTSPIEERNKRLKESTEGQAQDTKPSAQPPQSARPEAAPAEKATQPAERKQAPVETKQAQIETKQPGAEVKEPAAEANQAPVEAKQAAPETKQPGAETKQPPPKKSTAKKTAKKAPAEAKQSPASPASQAPAESIPTKMQPAPDPEVTVTPVPALEPETEVGRELPAAKLQ
jgi:hypothetical protein